MTSIGIFHTKGGVGKSSLTVFLADFLSSLHSQRILVVDLDPQGSTAKSLIPDSVIEAGVKEGRSIPALLLPVLTGKKPSKEQVQACLYRRSINGKAKKGSHLLGELAVLATDRPGWRTVTEKLSEIHPKHHWKYRGMLQEALSHVADDFDIVLIDFPGSEIPFWTLMGLHATDRWLLPEIPDYLSNGDIESVVELVHSAEHDPTHSITGLGTLLCICPHKGTGTYKKAKKALEDLERAKAIPPLFSKDAEVMHRGEAQKATDWKSEECKTLVQRYGSSTSPFHVGLRKLTKEVLERIGKPSSADELTVVQNILWKLKAAWK